MDQKRGLFIPEEENLRERGEWGQYTLWQQGGYPEGSGPVLAHLPEQRHFFFFILKRGREAVGAVARRRRQAAAVKETLSFGFGLLLFPI